MNYYFFASYLPPLKIGHESNLPFEEFKVLCQNNLSKDDLLKVQKISSFVDIANVRALWSGQNDNFDPRGNLSMDAMHDALEHQENLPSCVVELMEEYDNVEDRLKLFPRLYVTFFKDAIAQSSGFLREYFTFERDWRLVTLGFRAKKIGRDLTEELQFEEPHEEIVAHLLAQKDAPQYEPPMEYDSLKVLYDTKVQEPLKLHQALCAYRFDRITALLEGDIFSLDRILGFMVQLMITERWVEMDANKGKAIVDTMLKETR